MPKLPEWFPRAALTIAGIAGAVWFGYDLWLGAQSLGQSIGEPYALSSFR